MKQFPLFGCLLITTLLTVAACSESNNPSPAVLFDGSPSSSNMIEDFSLNSVAEYVNDGLLIGKTGNLVRLNRFYALGTRLVRYRINPSKDAVCLLQ